MKLLFIVFIWCLVDIYIASPTSSPTETTLQPTTTSSSGIPTVSPTLIPTTSPSVVPTYSPTTTTPSTSPSNAPTTTPSLIPTVSPTTSPSNEPTSSPTRIPTGSPTTSPSAVPTKSPIKGPTGSPTTSPSVTPTTSPSNSPTNIPTESPLEEGETRAPTNSPTQSPTLKPTKSPLPNGQTHSPTTSPTLSPTFSPTLEPTTSPTTSPTAAPTSSPTIFFGFVYSDWGECKADCKVDLDVLITGKMSRIATCRRGKGEDNEPDPNGQEYPWYYCPNAPLIYKSCTLNCSGSTESTSHTSQVLSIVAIGAVAVVGFSMRREIKRIATPAEKQPDDDVVITFTEYDEGVTPPPPPGAPPRPAKNRTIAYDTEARLKNIQRIHGDLHPYKNAKAAATRRQSRIPTPPTSDLDGPLPGEGALAIEQGIPTINRALKDEILSSYLIRVQMKPIAPPAPGRNGVSSVQFTAPANPAEMVYDASHAPPPPRRRQIMSAPTKQIKVNAEEVDIALDQFMKQTIEEHMVEQEEETQSEYHDSDEPQYVKSLPLKPSKPLRIVNPDLAFTMNQAKQVDDVVERQFSSNSKGRTKSFELDLTDVMVERANPNKTPKLRENFTESMEPYFKVHRLKELAATLPRRKKETVKPVQEETPTVVFLGHEENDTVAEKKDLDVKKNRSTISKLKSKTLPRRFGTKKSKILVEDDESPNKFVVRGDDDVVDRLETESFNQLSLQQKKSAVLAPQKPSKPIRLSSKSQFESTSDEVSKTDSIGNGNNREESSPSNKKPPKPIKPMRMSQKSIN